MKKKVIPMLIAIVLIFIVLAIAFGSMVYEKYSYSKEYADRNSYYNLEQKDEVAIVLQDQILAEKAKLFDDTFYFDIDTVNEYFTDRFYVNYDENVLIFTSATDVIKVNIGEDSSIYYIGDESQAVDYKAAIMKADMLYIAVDYLKMFSNFSYETFTNPARMQVYTEWQPQNVADIKDKTSIRYQGGVKSSILEDVSKGDQVIILEQLENWSKVKTSDAVIGYVENKFLTNQRTVEQSPVIDALVVDIESIHKDYTINLAFHQVFDQSSDSMTELVSRSNSITTVAPTWFRLNDNSGNFTSIANSDYVSKAHNLGLEVWAVLTDVDSKELYGLDVDLCEVFSHTENRKNMINHIISEVKSYGIDGINIDLETVGKSAGPHFVQFLRELSIETRKNNIVLSVDNFVPTEYTAHYNRSEQGLVADYIVIMGYDEHYAGGGVAGSVASINFVESGIKDTKAVVPKEKIINALPFYTRVWETDGGSIYGSTLTMRSQQDWVNKSGVTPGWDEATCQNYVEYQADGKTYQCWLEDVDSIIVKLNVMKAQEIAGVASWKLGIEDSSIWNTIDAYVSGN